MNNELIKLITESGIYEKSGIYNTKQNIDYSQKIEDYLTERIGREEYLEFDKLLSDYTALLEKNALISGFKLGVNLMKECVINE